MSIKLMAKIFDYPMKDLLTDKGKKVSASTASFILLALADHATDDGENVYPGVDKIKNKTKLSERVIVYGLNALEKNGYLIYVRFSRYGTKEYRIGINKINEEPEQTKPHPVHPHKKPHPVQDKPHPVRLKTAPSAPKPSLTIINHHKEAPDIVYEDLDDSGLPKIAKKKGNGREPKSKTYSIAQAISEVSGMSFEINRGRLLKVAKEIGQDERATPELIRKTFRPGGPYYKRDWRGKKGSKPTPNLVAELLFTWDEEPIESKEFTADQIRGARDGR